MKKLDPKLLEILACPETKAPVVLAEASLVAKLNAEIKAGTLHNRNGTVITEALDGGLLRADGQVLYPIRKDIPVLLIEEGIPINN